MEFSGIAAPSNLWVLHQKLAVVRAVRTATVTRSSMRTLKAEAVYDWRAPTAGLLHEIKRY